MFGKPGGAEFGNVVVKLETILILVGVAVEVSDTAPFEVDDKDVSIWGLFRVFPVFLASIALNLQSKHSNCFVFFLYMCFGSFMFLFRH